MPGRISSHDLAWHLRDHDARTRAIVRALRGTILRSVPRATEAFKFHVLCYFRDDAYFKSIGGNICMIEVKRDGVLLSFIHGSVLPDPKKRLLGRGKFKRFVRVPDVRTACSPALAALVRTAGALRPWD